MFLNTFIIRGNLRNSSQNGIPFQKEFFLEPNFPIIMIENECGTTLITSAKGTIFRDRPDILNFRAKVRMKWHKNSNLVSQNSISKLK